MGYFPCEYDTCNLHLHPGLARPGPARAVPSRVTCDVPRRAPGAGCPEPSPGPRAGSLPGFGMQNARSVLRIGCREPRGEELSKSPRGSPGAINAALVMAVSLVFCLAYACLIYIPRKNRCSIRYQFRHQIDLIFVESMPFLFESMSFLSNRFHFFRINVIFFESSFSWNR